MLPMRTCTTRGGGALSMMRSEKSASLLDGIETGVRQLVRDEPLETTRVEYFGQTLKVPTEAEILRIKGVLILRRNATRDYLDFVALALTKCTALVKLIRHLSQS